MVAVTAAAATIFENHGNDDFCENTNNGTQDSTYTSKQPHRNEPLPTDTANHASIQQMTNHHIINPAMLGEARMTLKRVQSTAPRSSEDGKAPTTAILSTLAAEAVQQRQALKPTTIW
jgi:hypothetical protein